MVVTHILYLQDEQTHALSPITFETVDLRTAVKWDQFAPDEQAVALVHALEVGVTELVARRERFKQLARATALAAGARRGG